MMTEITMDGQTFRATLTESAAGLDLLAQLSQTVEMADPAVGDLGYYAPGNDLVPYYGNQSGFPGIVILGRLKGDASAKIAGLRGRVDVTVKAG